LRDTTLTRRDFGRYAAAAGLAAMAPTLVSAAATEQAQSSPVPGRPRGGSVTYAQIGDPDSLDPQLAAIYLGFLVNMNIYDTLVGQKMDLTYEGILAESWEISADGLEYTFHLRKGIAFHDGSELNADAVKFTFDRILDPKTNSPSITLVGPLKETVVIDPYTVKLVLGEPFAPLLTNLATEVFIVPPGAVQRLGADFGKNPVGTGPFKFKEWRTGATVTLVRNESYQNFHSYIQNPGAPYLDGLVFSVIPDAATQVAAFQTGQIQVIDLPEREVASFKDDPDAQVVVTAGGRGLDYLEFATVKRAPDDYGASWRPPFDDLRVRQAAAYAIDADAIVKTVLFGLATRLFGPMPVGLFAYRPDIAQYGYHYDPNKAKALLDEAGWVAGSDGVRAKDGKKLDLLMGGWNEDIRVKCIQVLQNQLEQIGFKISVQLFDPATFIAKVGGDDQFNLDFTASGAIDPAFLYSIVNGAYSTLQYYRDKELLDLLDQGGKVADLDKRTAIYFEAQKKLLADCAMVPLWAKSTARGVRAEAKGYVPGPQGWGSYQDMYIEK
jgi:peptide/nickel transport system substrate-binding protein